jgi:hypothetical protein
MANICVIMSDNRPLVSDINSANYNSLTAYINACYCKKWGYDIKYIQPYLQNRECPELFNCTDPRTGETRHASWSKLITMQHMLNDKTYTHYVYIDSDCIFKDFSKPLTYLLDKMCTDILFLNNTPWGTDKPCAGFFILKNTDTCHKKMKDWYAISIPSKNKSHAWEQDALWIFISSLSYDLVDGEDWFFENNHQYLRHVAIHQETGRISYFKKRVGVLVSEYGNYTTVIKSIESSLLCTTHVQAN